MKVEGTRSLQSINSVKPCDVFMIVTGRMKRQRKREHISDVPRWQREAAFQHALDRARTDNFQSTPHHI